MTPEQYLRRVKSRGIENFGWDKHARALKITYEQAKDLWNKATNYEIKRMRRTEFSNRLLPELSSRWKNYYELELTVPYHVVNLTPTCAIVIPDGLIWDRGTVPYLLKVFVPNDHYKMMSAYLAHDTVCETRDMSNFMNDAVIPEVGEILQATWIERQLPYVGVRIGSPFRKGQDVVRAGFNISAHNRELIRKAEEMYLASGKLQNYQQMCAEITNN